MQGPFKQIDIRLISSK
nr:unnamed protein product [Callosobruchus analis]